MPGLSDLKIKIGAKKEPHNLAWINDKERSVLKAMGGSGKPGPMGIPAYYDDGEVDEVGYDPDIGPPPDDPNEGEERVGPVQKGFSFQTYDPELGWSGVVEGKPGDPYEEVGLEKVLGDYIRAHPFTRGMEKVGGFFGPKGAALTKGDIHEIGLEAMRTTDPDRDGINDGDEIIDEIKKVEVEEDLTPMQKYFKDIQSATKNDIGMSQMTPEEKLITSLGIQNRIIEPFEQWLATQEEAIRNLPRWLQSSKYREYAKNRTSSAQSYQPRTASMMASTEVIEDKTPATTELFNRLGMSNNIATAKGGGQILDNMVMRREGGLANYGFKDQLFGFDGPDTIMPPPPPPEPEIIYDPVREAAAEKAFRDIQARRISELDEAPQTRAEREALQAKGGFYRDEEGAVRDAMGNIQEDFGFDYVAPPEPDPYDPVNTPDTPAPVPEPEPFKLDTTPLPGGLVRNPETGEITVDPEGAKSTEWGYSREADKQGTPEEWSDFNEKEFLQQAYEKGKRYTGLGVGDLGGGWNIERTNPGSSIWNPPNSPSDYNYALKGPSTLRTMGTSIPQTGGPFPTFPQPQVIGQTTGLQGLQQGMGQGFNSQLFGRPAMQQQSMGQNLQGFGMQSPRPFGQKVY